MGEAACFCLIQLSGYTCIKKELSFVLKHFEAEWIMLAKEMVPALAPISVCIACLESIGAINIPRVNKRFIIIIRIIKVIIR